MQPPWGHSFRLVQEMLPVYSLGPSIWEESLLHDTEMLSISRESFAEVMFYLFFDLRVRSLAHGRV